MVPYHPTTAVETTASDVRAVHPLALDPRAGTSPRELTGRVLSQLRRYMLLEGAACAALLCGALCMASRPKRAPARSATVDRTTIRKGLPRLLRQPQFWAWYASPSSSTSPSPEQYAEHILSSRHQLRTRVQRAELWRPDWSVPSLGRDARPKYGRRLAS